MPKNPSIEWSLTGPPWVQYRTRLDLLGQPEDDAEVVAARRAMLADPQIQALLREVAGWPGQPLVRHNDASHLLHKLVFLADLGVRATDPGVGPIVQRVLERQSPEGAFEILTNISPRYGGTGTDHPGWMLCDAPSVLYALCRLGLTEEPAVHAAARHLAGLIADNGWPCTVSARLGSFRGPGRKTDPCPHATLVSLKALSQIPEWRDSSVCMAGGEALLALWEQRKEHRPYLFAMGTDFAKLKAPMVWYDILHVLDVLTRFPRLHKDPRLLEMADIVRAKADEQGRFTAESVWKAWSDWEFGQKKSPSLWLTLSVWRVVRRIGGRFSN